MTDTARGHHWLITLPGLPTVASDHLTLDEVELLENVSGVAWSNVNPLRTLKNAKAWALVAAMHAGDTEEQATERLAGLNLGGIKGAFQLELGDAPAPLEGDVEQDPPPSAPTSAAG